MTLQFYANITIKTVKLTLNSNMKHRLYFYYDNKNCQVILLLEETNIV